MKQLAKTSEPRVYKFRPVDHDPFSERLVYIIRHGKTSMNSESGKPEQIRGWNDIPLTEEGRRDAEKLGRELADADLELLFHSDLKRAKETAKFISDATGAQAISDPGLRSWNVGNFVGESSNQAGPEIIRYAENAPDKPLPGGESFNQFKDRVFNSLRNINAQSLGKRIGIITHHSVERLINAWKEAGEKPDHDVDLHVMFEKGEKPATAQEITLRMNAL